MNVKTIFFFFILVLLSHDSYSGVERTKYLHKEGKELSDFREFNLTSKETEMYHGIDRIDLLRVFHLAKVRSDSSGKNLQDRIESINARYDLEKEQLEEFWSKFYADESLLGSLYFVSYSAESGSDFTGYYLIKNGEIIKKSIDSW